MSILSITKVLIKSLFHGPYTKKFPKEEKEFFDGTRGKIGITISECIYCGMCQRRCPTGAIQVEKAESKWSIQRLQCIQCGYCVEVCPKKCLRMDSHYSSPTYEKERDEYLNA